MPVTKQSIAFIGAIDAIGSAIVQGATNGNYRILLLNREAKNIKCLADDIRDNATEEDVEVMDCARECSWEANIIIINLSDKMLDEVLAEIRDVATQKIIIPLTSTLRQDLENTTGYITEKLCGELPYSKIVQLSVAGRFDQKGSSNEASLTIYGEDRQALEIVSELIETAGFRPVVKTINCR